MERPLALAGAGVIAEDVARHVLDAGLVVALLGRVADDHHAVDHDRRGRAGDVAQLARDAEVGVVGAVPALPGAPVGDQIGEQVDDTGPRKPRQRHRRAPVLERPAGRGIERMEKEGGADDVDDPTPIHLGVGHALAVAIAHAAIEAGGMRLAVGPERLAARRVDRDHRAAVARDRVEDAVDVDRGRARHPERARPEVVAAPDPGHLEVLEVIGADLIEGRVAGVRGIPADEPPLARGRSPVLRPGPGRSQQDAAHSRRDKRAERSATHAAPRDRALHVLILPRWRSHDRYGFSTISIRRNAGSSAGSGISPAGYPFNWSR